MKNKKISKPWAVYGWYLGPMGIGKIIEISEKTCHIQYSSDQRYEPQCWDLSWVNTFKTSEEAIDYFLIKNSHYFRKELVETVSSNFPKERKRLEKILAQSLPKYTPESCRTLGDEMGRVSHPYQ